MKPAVTFPDPEALLVPVVADLCSEYQLDASVSVGRPDGWTPDDGLHIEVAWDGTPEVVHPIVAWPTVRIVVHGPADQPSLVKDAARLLCGVLPSTPGAGFQLLTGVLPTPDTERPGVLMAAFTGRVTTRAQIAEPLSGS